MQHEITLVVRARQARPDRLELEGEIVAERAVQPQVLLRRRERGHDLTQRGEHGGAAASLLLGEGTVRLGDDDRHLRGAGQVAGAARLRAARPGIAGRAAQRGADHRQQHRPPLVQRPGRDPPPGRDDLDARVHVGQVPAAVPARVLHSGAEHAAAAAIDLRRDLRQQRGVEPRGGPGYPHSGGGDELRVRCLGTRVVRLSGIHGVPSGSDPAAAARKATAVSGRSLRNLRAART